jgi:hypothetical protein
MTDFTYTPIGEKFNQTRSNQNLDKVGAQAVLLTQMIQRQAEIIQSLTERLNALETPAEPPPPPPKKTNRKPKQEG